MAADIDIRRITGMDCSWVMLGKLIGVAVVGSLPIIVASFFILEVGKDG
jgi:hypothetical protein